MAVMARDYTETAVPRWAAVFVVMGKGLLFWAGFLTWSQDTMDLAWFKSPK